MGMGQTLNILEQRLLVIRGRVRQVALDVLGSGKAPGAGSQDPSQAARVERLGGKLASVQAELAQILRMLQNAAHELDERERIAWRVGREHRYRALQSARSHAGRQREVYQLLQDIIQDLEDLFRGTGALTTADLMGLGSKLNSEYSHFTSAIQEAQALVSQPSQPAFVAAGHTVNVGWSTMVMMAYMLVLMLRERARRRNGA
jgi:ElaB/YqjD/DUF883 family membrane-anchored ribosome-binding protein